MKVCIGTIVPFQPDLIVLAGFLLKFSESIIKRISKVINIHPFYCQNTAEKECWHECTPGCFRK